MPTHSIPTYSGLRVQPPSLKWPEGLGLFIAGLIRCMCVVVLGIELILLVIVNRQG